MAILKAENVVFQSILRYPDIEIEENTATFVQGPSGCGKSTLLRLFNGTLSPDSGRLYFEGQDISEADTVLLRQRVLLIGQTAYLFRGDIETNFRRFYEYRDMTPLAPRDMEYYLNICSAPFPLTANCDTMSGGERQRVYCAVCLSLKPRVLMMDEPTSALDSKTADGVIANIKEYCADKGITLLVVSHDSKLREKFADKTIFLEKQV